MPGSEDKKTYLDIFPKPSQATPSEFAIDDKFLNYKSSSPASQQINAEFQNQFIVKRNSSIPLKNYTRRDTAILDSAHLVDLAVANTPGFGITQSSQPKILVQNQN